jgi:hypothetical protein
VFVPHEKENAVRNSGIHNINFSGVTASDADHDTMENQTILLTHFQVT